MTVNGDSSGQTNPFTLYINAYSPSLGLNVSTQVQLATSSVSTSSSYQIQGLPDGVYQALPPICRDLKIRPASGDLLRSR